MMAKGTATRKLDAIRAGGTYPTAVPSSYFESSNNSARKVLKKHLILSSNRNTRLRPAFGATRDEGAVGPIEALSPYSEVVDYNRRCRGSTHLKPTRRIMASPVRPERVATGPTAETIISMTAAGKKPPLPGEKQIEKHKESLSQISVNIKAAISRQTQFDNTTIIEHDENLTSESIRFPEKIPGYHQTWGAAFSQDTVFAPLTFSPGPGGARYPHNYPPGDNNSK